MRSVISHVVVLLGIATLSACAISSGRDNQARVLEPVTRIAVMPVTLSAASAELPNSYVKDNGLQKGAELATRIIADTLSGHPKVVLLTKNQVTSATPEVAGGFSGAIATLGETFHAEAVLVTEIHTFKQREGNEYASEAPASAAFSMVLYHTGKKSVLWSADFQETQESLLENIFTIEKVQKRGLKWITVEELLSQGIKDRLAECPYLAL